MVYNLLKCLDQEMFFFFSKGLSTATLKTCGTYPDFRGRLVWSNIDIPIKEKTFLSSRVGMASNIHMNGLPLLVEVSSERSIGEKRYRVRSGLEEVVSCRNAHSRSWLSLVYFFSNSDHFTAKEAQSLQY